MGLLVFFSGEGYAGFATRLHGLRLLRDCVGTVGLRVWDLGFGLGLGV